MEKHFRVIRIREPTKSLKVRWKIGISAPILGIEVAHLFAQKVMETNENVYMVRFLRKKFASLRSLSKAELYIEARSGEEVQRFIDQLHFILTPQERRSLLPHSCKDLPLFMANLPALSPDITDCIFTFSQGGEEGIEYRHSLSTPELQVEFDGPNYYKYFGTLDLSMDQSKYRKALNRIDKALGSAKKALKGKKEIFPSTKNLFTSLLWTHNTKLDTALRLLTGEYRLLQGVSKIQGRETPAGRGAQFRWGMDSQYGEVIFVMRPEFHQNYTRGVSAKTGNFVNHVVLTDFWAGKEGKEEQFEETLLWEASEFTFRNPRKPQSPPLTPCSEIDRGKYTWCNVQLHIGENVSLYDVDVVFIPRYLEHSKVRWKGKTISAVLRKVMLDRYSFSGDVNPFRGRIVFYGLSNPLGEKETHSHYASVLREPKRSEIYEEILKGYRVVETIKAEQESDIYDLGLHRSREMGHSSTLALSYQAFVEAQYEYMKRLLYYGLFLNSLRLF